MSRTLSRLKREGGISLEMSQWKRASSRFEGRISWFFLTCGSNLRVPLELRRGHQGPARVASGKPSLHANSERALGIPLQSLPGTRSSCGVEAGTSELFSSADMDLGVLSSFHRGVSLILCGDMQVRSPLEMEKQCQASCHIDIGIGGFLSRGYRAVTPTTVF